VRLPLGAGDIGQPPGAETRRLFLLLPPVPMTDPIISRVRFADGAERDVFEQLDGRQYVLDDDGEPTHGVWYIPPDGGTDLPVIVEWRG
jgi:hypothetical protein